MDFNSTCRICAREYTSLKSLFHSNKEPIRKILMAIASVKFDEDDGLPSKICQYCIKQVEAIITIKDQIEDANAKFLEQLNSSIKKEHSYEDALKSEPEDEIDYLEDIDDIKSEEIEGESIQYLEEIDKRISSPVPKKRKLTRRRRRHSTTDEGDSLQKKTRKRVPVPCPICGKISNGNYRLKLHMYTHSENKPFICVICGNGFTDPTNLRRHVRTHSNVKPHVCETCGKGFIQRTTLQAHLNVHLRKGATAVEGSEFCDICNHSYPEADKHFHENHYQCDVCGQVFVSKVNLKRHVMTHSGEKNFKCDVCSKSFRYSAGLYTHKKIHTGVKEFECDVCHRRFLLNGALTDHMRIHSGERPFDCEWCGKAFTQRTHLNRHRKLHTGEKPYECDLCGKAFYDGTTMRKHRRTHELGEVKIERLF